MLSLLIIVLGFSLVIGIHEGSHMLVSKLFGVRVIKFALGFGPILFAKKYGDTSYELRLLPLGGFIQCSGEDPESNTEGGFFSTSWWQRSLIALAGPVANLLLGFVLIWLLLVFGKGWPTLLGLGRAWTIFSLIITETLKFIWGFVIGSPASNSSGLAGPIMITKMMVTTLKEGLFNFTFLLSVVSLSLGLFNLFPIPGLDGGHIILYILESFKGSKFSSKVYTVWAYIGIILLVNLMLITVILDLLKL